MKAHPLAMWLHLAFVIACGTFTTHAQPQFYSNYLPSVVYPGPVTFDVWAFPGDLEYQLLSAPTNVSSHLVSEHPVQFRINWNTPAEPNPGITNVFVVRASDPRTQLSATNAFRFTVHPLPPINLAVSNGLPVLHCTSLISNHTYFIETTRVMPATNWTVLAPIVHPPFPVTVVDTNPAVSQRFYVLRTSIQFFCLADCP